MSNTDTRVLTPVTVDQVLEADASLQHDATNGVNPWSQIPDEVDDYLQVNTEVTGVPDAVDIAFLLGRRAQAIADGTWEHPSKEEIEEERDDRQANLNPDLVSEGDDDSDVDGFDALMAMIGAQGFPGGDDDADDLDY